MAETPEEILLDHIDALVAYWSGAVGEVLDPAMPCSERLEGLAFSLLVMLDGCALDGCAWWLAQIDEEAGEVGENIAGGLHDRYVERLEGR